MWPYGSTTLPWRPMADVVSQLERWMTPWARTVGALWRGSSNFPPVRIVSNDDALVLCAEIPGINLSDLELTVTGDTLTIKGERKADETVPEAQYHRRERLSGHFARSVTLPERVQNEKISATYTDGVLRVVMPKAPEARTRKIQVGVK
jgi:HSP20 family protein